MTDEEILFKARQNICSDAAYAPSDKELSAVMRYFQNRSISDEQREEQVFNWIESEFKYPCPIYNPARYAEWKSQGFPED